jgi:FMN phosphatase YigB (HAD superfamily)
MTLSRSTLPDNIQAILFDLDGTLLGNDMEVFLPHYFRALTARVADAMGPEAFMAHLMSATEVMMANDGRATNEEVFASAFYPLAGREQDEWEPVFYDFYARDFGALQEYTHCKPEARRVVQLAFDLGLKVVIATNPLFPEQAIRHRMEWAGVADFEYDLVTTYENSRAVKPNLLYFENILATIGCPAEASMVVGDENMDMVAAHLGCITFLVPGARTDLAPTTPRPAHEGTLLDLEGMLAK